MRVTKLQASLLLWLVAVSSCLAQNAPCAICDVTPVPNPDFILPKGTAGITTEEMTCAELDADAQAGLFSSASCLILRRNVASTCCVAPPGFPTVAPSPIVSEPPVVSAAPTPAVTTAPTESPGVTNAPSTSTPVSSPEPTPSGTTEPPVTPTSAPSTTAPVPGTTPPSVTAPPAVTTSPSVTAAPSSGAPTVANATGVPVPPNATTAPTSTPVPPNATTAPTSTPARSISGIVSIRLISLPGELTGTVQDDYVASCETFFVKHLKRTENITVSWFSDDSSRVRRRNLQSPTLKPVDTTLRVTGTTSIADANDEAFGTALVETVAENQEDFIAIIQDQQNEESKTFFASVTQVLAFPPTELPPTQAPVTPPTPEKEDEDDTLSGGAIFGIVFGVLVGGVLIIGAAYQLQKKGQREGTPRPLEVGNPDVNPVVKPEAQTYTPVEKVAAPMAVAAAATNRFPEEEGERDISVASSDQPQEPSGIIGASDAEDQSAVTGDAGDQMSYAYSLDPGNVDQATADKSSEKKSGGESGTGGSQSGDEMSSHAMSSLRQNLVSRTVLAPPGKLGIVIDTTLEGPVVHKVNPQSPLEGTLFPGDIIVAIDDVDTRAMSASAITALMVRTANQRRKLTVLSEDVAS